VLFVAALALVAALCLIGLYVVAGISLLVFKALLGLFDN
jgi:hypothetical protein